MTAWYQKEQLHFAATDGDLEKVKELIAEGYDVNALDSGLSFTPLHHAVKGNHLLVARYLLGTGANVNVCEENKCGNTPLGEVAGNCSYAMAELLINAGEDPTLTGWMGLSALERHVPGKVLKGSAFTYYWRMLLKGSEPSIY